MDGMYVCMRFPQIQDLPTYFVLTALRDKVRGGRKDENWTKLLASHPEPTTAGRTGDGDGEMWSGIAVEKRTEERNRETHF